MQLASLDPGDNQLSVFVDYFLAAIERLFPEVVRRIAVGPNHGTATSFAPVARRLADTLDEVDEHFTIILDDYHFIRDPDIHHFLMELLRFPPRGLNLVISSPRRPASAVGNAACTRTAREIRGA